MLDRVPRHHRRVPGGPARDEHDLVHILEPAALDAELREHDHAEVVDPAAQRIANRLGLLVNLLEQEVRIAVLLRLLRLPVDGDDARLDSGAVELLHADPIGRRGDDLALAEQRDALRVRDQRGDVAADEDLTATETHDERRVDARPDDAVRLIGRDDHQCARTLHAVERRCGLPRRGRRESCPR